MTRQLFTRLYPAVLLETLASDMVDCWGSSQRTRTEQEDFKNRLIDYYERNGVQPGDVKCMILDTDLPRKDVVAAHLWKRATRGKGLQLLGLPRDAVHHVRNGLLLHRSIEAEFDDKNICFLYNAITSQLVCKVLNPSIMEKVCGGVITNVGSNASTIHGLGDCC